MAIMYLSKEKFTCPIVQISWYLAVLKHFSLSKTVWNHADINYLGKQCRSRSDDFFISHLIRIHTVFNATCELIRINQNIKYKILLTCPRTRRLKLSTCPEWNGTRSDKSGMVFPQPWLFALLVFLVSCDCYVALPHDATGLSAVCDCGISWSYSLFLMPMLSGLGLQYGQLHQYSCNPHHAEPECNLHSYLCDR